MTIEEIELEILFESAFNRLTKLEAESIRLKFFHSYTYHEIGLLLEEDPKFIRKKALRGLRKLKKIIGT